MGMGEHNAAALSGQGIKAQDMGGDGRFAVVGAPLGKAKVRG